MADAVTMVTSSHGLRNTSHSIYGNMMGVRQVVSISHTKYTYCGFVATVVPL